MLALVMVAVPILGQVRPPSVMLDGRGRRRTGPSRSATRSSASPPAASAGHGGPRARRTSWDEWTAVGVRAPGGDGQVLRLAHGSLYRGAVAVDDTAGEPFATLARARGLDLHAADDPIDERLAAYAPNDVMNLRFATPGSPDSADRVVDEDLPELRAQVGAELGLASRLRVTHLRAPDLPDEPQGPVAVLDLPPVGATGLTCAPSPCLAGRSCPRGPGGPRVRWRGLVTEPLLDRSVLRPSTGRTRLTATPPRPSTGPCTTARTCGSPL